MALWLTYRRILAISAVAVFFAGTADYLFGAGVTSVPPLYPLIVLAGLALPLLLVPGTIDRVVAAPVMRWCAFYVVFSALAFTWSSQSDTAWSELKWRVLTAGSLGSLLVVFADGRVLRTTRAAVVGAVLLGIVLNVVDILRPLTFSQIVGRSAGLHVNPNSSAIALVLGMLIGIDLIPQRLRPWFVSLVGFGVLLTFSRGGAVAWILASSLLVASGRVGLGRLLGAAAVGVLGGVAFLLLTGWWDAVAEGLPVVLSDNALGRLRVSGGLTDASTGVRLGAARLAWEMFTQRPLLGWGVGATAEWDWPESTHNIYLRHLAEYGVGGLAIVPLLMVALLWRRRLSVGAPAVWIASVTVVWGMFSHSLLDERHVLLSIALLAASSPSMPSIPASAAPTPAPEQSA